MRGEDQKHHRSFFAFPHHPLTHTPTHTHLSLSPLPYIFFLSLLRVSAFFIAVQLHSTRSISTATTTTIPLFIRRRVELHRIGSLCQQSSRAAAQQPVRPNWAWGVWSSIIIRYDSVVPLSSRPSAKPHRTARHCTLRYRICRMFLLHSPTPISHLSTRSLSIAIIDAFPPLPHELYSFSLLASTRPIPIPSQRIAPLHTRTACVHHGFLQETAHRAGLWLGLGEVHLRTIESN